MLKESHYFSGNKGTGNIRSVVHSNVTHNDELCERKLQSHEQSASCLNSLIMLLVVHQRPCNNRIEFLLSISW